MERTEEAGILSILGFDRLALCPRMTLEISSLPSVSSFMSLDMADLAPAEVKFEADIFGVLI